MYTKSISAFAEAFILSIAIISMCAFAPRANAQDSSPTEAPTGPVVLGEAMVTAFTDESLALSFTATNYTGDPSVRYGMEIYAGEGDTLRLVDAIRAESATQADQGAQQAFTVTTDAPKILSGAHTVSVVARSGDGKVLASIPVDTITFIGTNPSATIVTESCVFKDNAGNVTPASAPLALEGDAPITLVCSVINYGNTEQTVSLGVVTRTGSLFGDTIDLGNDPATQTLAPNSVTEMTFNVPRAPENGAYSARATLKYGGMVSSPLIFSYTVAGVMAPEPVANVLTDVYETSSGIANVIVITLALFAVLAAILVYRKRNSLPAHEMIMPKE